MGRPDKQRGGRGPFLVDQLREGDRYELSRGHPYYCAPTGGDGARGTGIGFLVLATDPDVEEAGIDAGYALDENTLRAPDVSVGNVPDRPGWVKGVPPLAVEYAGTGQDEQDRATKIEELLEAGTRWVWVVRLIGPRRVEVHERGLPVVTLGPGQSLSAPGVLRHRVPVEALWDREAANQHVLANLLARRGYESIEDVRGQGREEGREEGRRAHARQTIRRALARRGVALDDALSQRLDAEEDLATLDRWLDAALDAQRASDVFGT